MTKHERIPGIYMIRNKLDGKVYIGQSRDIAHRIKYYKWAEKTECNYNDTRRDITKAIRKYGIDNFEVIVLMSGPEFADDNFRLRCEKKCIAKYKADNPDYGYNESAGGECGASTPRIQSTLERLNRAKPVILYDTKKDRCIAFLGGARAAGTYLGYGKDVMSHSVKRGSIIDSRYYIVPYTREKRHELLDKIIARTEREYTMHRSKVYSENVVKRYRDAIKRIDEITK